MPGYFVTKGLRDAQLTRGGKDACAGGTVPATAGVDCAATGLSTFVMVSDPGTLAVEGAG